MSLWKQIVISLILLAVAIAGWFVFFPGAHDTLARLGIVARQENAAADSAANSSANVIAPGSVVIAPVAMATINDRLQAIGTGRAKGSVAVTPFVSGRLVEITVQPGAKVVAGQAIGRLDSDMEEIALDRARIARDDAQAKLERIKTLLATNTATEVQLTDAEVVLRAAELTVRDAALALERRTIEAPGPGAVGILQVDAGNYVTSSTPIVMIEDRSTILVDFWVPERFAPAISVGQPVAATSIARPGSVFQGTVIAVDNRLDEASRTLHVRAALPNPDDTLRAGMSFQISMRFPGDTYPSVNPLAIQWGTDGAFVWALSDGRAKRMPVRIVQRNTENVLVQAPLSANDQVVTEGVHIVREGSRILVAQAEPTTGEGN